MRITIKPYQRKAKFVDIYGDAMLVKQDGMITAHFYIDTDSTRALQVCGSLDQMKSFANSILGLASGESPFAVDTGVASMGTITDAGVMGRLASLEAPKLLQQASLPLSVPDEETTS